MELFYDGIKMKDPHTVEKQVTIQPLGKSAKPFNDVTEEFPPVDDVPTPAPTIDKTVRV